MTSFTRGRPDSSPSRFSCSSMASQPSQSIACGARSRTHSKVGSSTGSEFTGFIADRYTTLEPTRERILATAVTARWRHAGAESDWGESFAATRALLLETFATTHSLSLQQTLHAMATAVLEARPEIVEVRMSMPNKHHFAVDLTPFGLDNPNEVFHADDRPYGLIEAAVHAAGAPPAGPAWDPYPLL